MGKTLANTDCYFYDEDSGHGYRTAICLLMGATSYECPCNIEQWDIFDETERYECPNYISTTEAKEVIMEYINERNSI